MAALMALAAGVGPMLTGVTYNAYSGYGSFLAMGVEGSALCGILMISLPPIRPGRSAPLIEVIDLRPGRPAA